MSRTFNATDLAALALPAEPAVSPDGTRIAYTLATTEGGAARSALWLASAAGGTPLPLTRPGRDGSPVWRPDGAALAFLRSVDGGAAQLWLVPADGGEPEPLTTPAGFPHGAGTPAWAADGRTVYFSAPVDIAAPPPGGDDAPALPGAAPIVADRLDYKSDDGGYAGSLRRHLVALDTATGASRRLTDGDWDAGEPAVSPDGTKLAFTAARDADRDLTQTSQAWYVDLADDTQPARRIGHADAVTGPVEWLADGSAVIATGLARMDIRNAALWRLALDPAVPDASLTTGLDRNVMPGGPGYPGGRARVLPGGDVLFCLREGGNTHVYRAGTDGVCRPVLTGGHRVVSGLSAAAGTIAVVVAGQHSFGEVGVVAADGTLKILTTLSADALPDVELVAAAPRTFTVSDGGTVPGWLIRAATTTGPGPVLLDVHGGPHNAWTGTADAMHPYHQMLAAKGWTILLLNVRGSDGYGEAFLRGVHNAWGEADHADWMEPLDQLVAEGLADPARLAVAGYSYGGFATCSMTSRTNRFAAAVAGGLVCDLRNFPGASDQGVFLAHTELCADTDPDTAARLSPITRADRVRTPTLVLHGADDQRCPVNQAEQWFAALRLAGVDTRLVLYPGQGHPFVLDGPLRHRIDYSNRVVDWLERHVPATRAAVPALDAAHWRHRLDTLAAKYGVPGAVFGMLRTAAGGGEERVVAAAGVTNLATGEAFTADTLVQLGSIGKTWTATLVLQLAAEGKLDLDAPIRDVLADFRVADAHASATITMRHLLTHTSGLDGDIFTDTGRGDDCVERYVASLADAGQVFAPGQTWSYCNTGLVIAGRVVEVLRGMSWDAALAEHILKPLGLTETTTLPEQTALHRFAVGHLGAGGETRVTPSFLIPRSAGPAGLVTASADDALTYARSFLPGGEGLLPQPWLARMLSPQVAMGHACTIADAWALGWCLQDWDGVPTVNHNGATFGQNSYLRLFPEQGLVLFLSVNGGRAEAIHRELFTEAALLLAGARMPAAYAPAAPSLAPERLHEYAGVYEAAGLRIDVRPAPAGPDPDAPSWQAVTTDTSGLVTDGEERVFALVPGPDGEFGAALPDAKDWVRLSFETVDGAPLLHFGTRAYPQVTGRGR
ncbi:serine hydrolase [Specibacter cremeus]|uniref:serine hydrolase n=1 Tax=Specibacter cremeus TaxID=1629051 RepID=UPI000F77A687|nr:serine hydrolase [Specibacter cremeus]